MLRVVYLTTLISAIHLLKYCVYFCYGKNCNHPFFEVNVSFLLVVPRFVTHCQSLLFVVTRCAASCLSLSFIVICCHSLSFVVTRYTSRCHLLSLVVIRCHSLYHSLSLVVIRCHSLSLNVPLVYLFINDVSTTDPAIPYLTYLFFFYLLAGPVKVHVKYQRRKLLQQQNPVNQDLFYPLAVSISNNDPFEKT